MKPESLQFLPFALPEIGDEEIAEVIDSLRSGWITTGPKAKRFETDFAVFLGGGADAVSVNSATAGLHLAVEAIGVSQGDEVITTTHTFTATAEVVRYLGAEPVFVDIDLDTYCIDPAGIERKMSRRTRAVLPVHYGGYPCEMDAICSQAAHRGLKVIEDAAHALPTRYKGKLIGTLDTAACVFSFYATKTITTGEGGMLVTRDAELGRRARVMRLHGIDRDTFNRYTSDKPAWYYEVIAPGYKYNMTDVAAAMGIHQLRKANRFHERRCMLARRYDEEFRNLPLVLPPRPANEMDHAWHLYVVRLRDDAKTTRDAVVQKLYDHGIGCSVHYVPLHVQPYWRDRYGLKQLDFPNSQKLYERGLSLPIYTKMTDMDQQRVVDAMKACFISGRQ